MDLADLDAPPISKDGCSPDRRTRQHSTLNTNFVFETSAELESIESKMVMNMRSAARPVVLHTYQRDPWKPP